MEQHKGCLGWKGHLDDTVSITPEDTCWAELSVGVQGPNGHSDVVIFLEFWCLIYSMMHMNYSKSKTSPVWAPSLN